MVTTHNIIPEGWPDPAQYGSWYVRPNAVVIDKSGKIARYIGVPNTGGAKEVTGVWTQINKSNVHSYRPITAADLDNIVGAFSSQSLK